MSKKKPFSPETGRLSDVLMAAIAARPDMVEFTTLDLVAASPEIMAFLPPGKDPAKSIAQGVNALKRRGKLHIVARKRCNGEVFTRPVFARGPGADFVSPEPEYVAPENEPDAAVTREALPNGNTLVRFGMGWKPAHRTPRAIGMLGYTSALADANP